MEAAVAPVGSVLRASIAYLKRNGTCKQASATASNQAWVLQ